MDYIVHIMRSINYIEENLRNEINLNDCARASGYSDYHFIRVFKEATKLTPSDYIRKRRLTEIIKHINENTSISEIAFEYGFNSKENFTRAFVSEHHILPTEYKAAKNSLKLFEAINFETPKIEITPKIINIERFDLIVYRSDETYAPNFWNKYNSRKWSKKLSGGKVCEDYGVNVWNNNEGKHDYYAGIRKENASGNLDGTNELQIQGGLYAIFTTPPRTQFDFVNTIHHTWAYILNIWIPQSPYRCADADRYQFESYIEDSRTFSEDIFIPIEMKS